MLYLLDNKVWLFFVTNPLTEVHIRELARKLNLSPTTVLKLLAPLMKKDLLKTKKEGKNTIIASNYDNELFIFYKKWSNLVLLIDSEIISEIKVNNPNSIVLFGSYSIGEDTEKSDIDIATDVNVKINIEKYETILKRKIQIHNINNSINPLLLENIKQGILLYGVMK